MQQTTTTKLYGLIGFPLGHSFSKDFFNKKFISENIDAQYVNFEISQIEEIKNVIGNNKNLCGLNVTIPYKQQIIPFLDEIDDDAKEIGAVNVIKFIRKNDSIILKGFNSDVIGFTDSIKSLLKPCHTSALILGTGGASKAVKHALLKLGIDVQFVSRKKSEHTIIYEELTKAMIKQHKIIVNTTPLGMYPKVDQAPDIPYRFLTSEHLSIDLIYNPDETLFMKKSKEAGAVVKNGLEMLILQAFASYDIWNS